jgi:3-oxoacyl-[acyl-carrier protein] reductase
MNLQLKGKKAIVLGGTRGIGRAIAETLAAEGADVGLCARKSEQVKETVAALTAKGVRATGAAVDIADGMALKAWVSKAGEELGGIDILISNAGAMVMSNNEEAWLANLKTDVLGAVNAFEVAHPSLEKAAAANGDAAFVIIASISAAESDYANAYGPIKAALIHLAKGLARQYAKQHIRTNVVSPGSIYFDGGVWQTVEKTMPKLFETVLAGNPTGRMGTAQEIANAAVFLASPAASFTTGANLVVDGAFSRRVNY